MREARATDGGRLTHLRAAAAYRGLLAFAWVLFDMTVEVLTRRWVERTFGWLGQ